MEQTPKMIADHIPSLATLTDEEKKALSAIIIERKVRKNEMIVRDGQICHYMV